VSHSLRTFIQFIHIIRTLAKHSIRNYICRVFGSLFYDSFSVTRPKVPKLWGAVIPLGDGRFYMSDMFILNEMDAQDKIYILVSTLLS
jgi:hypothetical protein